MADSFVRVPADSVGKRVDASSLDVGADTVYRQRVVIGDNAATAEFATVIDGILQVGGSFTLTGTATVAGNVNISATAIVAGNVNISTMPAVVLAAGTNNFGTLNHISRTVQVAVGTPFILQGISTTVTVVGNINVSATATAIIGAVLDATNATPVRVGDSANTAIRVNVVAGGAGGGAVFGQVSAGASLSTTHIPVLIGGNDSAGGGIARTLLLDTSGRVILGAGAQNIGIINNISATVGITGTVALAAGTANIGTLNDISRTVQVAIGTPYILQGISTTVQVAIATPYTIQAISTTVTVAGNVNISTMPAITINGGVAHSASVTAGVIPVITGLRAGTSASAAVAHRDATYAWGDKFGRQVVVNNHPSLLPSASHGPKCVTCSTSAGVALIAAPGAGLSVYITEIACTNGSGTLTRADVFPASATASCHVSMFMAASGGGFVRRFDPPIQVTSNTGVTCRVDPAVVEAIFNVHFYVGPK